MKYFFDIRQFEPLCSYLDPQHNFLLMSASPPPPEGPANEQADRIPLTVAGYMKAVRLLSSKLSTQISRGNLKHFYDLNSEAQKSFSYFLFVTQIYYHEIKYVTFSPPKPHTK